MSTSGLLHALCSGSPKQVLVKCLIALIVVCVAFKYTLNAMRGAFNMVFRVGTRLLLFLLVAAVLIFGAKHLAEGKEWSFKGDSYVPRLAKELLPSNWKLVEWYRGDLDGDSVPEYLLIYKFDQTLQKRNGGNEKAEAANPLGAVVLDREKNVRPESSGRRVPYSPGSYLPYGLLPDLHAGAGLGVGRSDARPVLYTAINPPEIGIFGYDYSPWVTTFSLYRWGGSGYRIIGRWEGNEGVLIYPEKAGTIPKAKGNDIPKIAGTFVNRIVVHNKLPGRSALCEEMAFFRKDEETKFEEEKPMVALCHGKPGSRFHPFYPEEVVTAFYQALAEGNQAAARSYTYSSKPGRKSATKKPSDVYGEEGELPCDPDVLRTLDERLEPYVKNPDKAKIRLVRVEYNGTLTCHGMSAPAPLDLQSEITGRLRRAYPVLPPPAPTLSCESEAKPFWLETGVRVTVVVDDGVKYYATWLLGQFPEGSNVPSLSPKWVLCGVEVERIEKVVNHSQGSP